MHPIKYQNPNVNNFVNYLLIVFFLFNFTQANFTKIEFSDHALF